MTSESDSSRRRRPPTIDLTATEVETEASESSAADEPSANGAGRRARWTFPRQFGALAIGAAAGAVIVAALGLGVWFAGFVPGRSLTPASPNNADVSAQLNKIQTKLQTRPADTVLLSRLAAVEAQTKALGDSVAGLNRRLDDAAVAAQTAREHADAASASAKQTAQTAQGAAQRSDLDALANRIAALDRQITTLANKTAQPQPSANDRAARAAVAAEALRAVVERGVPFTAELAAVKSFGASAKAIAALEPFAGGGVPRGDVLAHELAQLAPSLRQTSGAASNDGSFLGRLESHAKNLVRVTPVDAPASDEAQNIVARIAGDAARADIAAALADIARLPQSAKPRTEPWVQKATAREAAIAASRRIAADALAALGAANSQ